MRDQLQRLLEDHKPSDDLERRHLAAMLALCRSATNPTSRTHFRPGHFTASSFVLHPDDDRVLLIYHGKLHRWLQPGGHIDPDDPTPAAAARREVAEETSIRELEPIGQGFLDVDVHNIPALKGDPPHEHHDVRFLFRARTGHIVAASDAHDVRWVPLHEVTLEGPNASDESVLRAVRKIQRQLG